MPFTLAHPAAALPLRRLGLPLTALVAGSLAPDVPLFVPGGLLGTRDEAHSWTHTPLGVVTFCLPVGVLLTALWLFFVREPVLDGAPPAVRERIGAVSRLPRGYWPRVLPAVALAVLVHLAFDQITHAPSWTTARVGLLRQQVAGHAVAGWLMYVLSVLGLVILAWAAWRAIARRMSSPVPHEVPWLAPWLLPVPLFAGAAAALDELLTKGPYMGLHANLYYMLTAGIGVTGAVALVLCVVWHVARRQVREARPGRHSR